MGKGWEIPQGGGGTLSVQRTKQKTGSQRAWSGFQRSCLCAREGFPLSKHVRRDPRAPSR